MITINRIKELLLYDHETGIFRWKVMRGGSLPGSIAGSLTWNGYHHIMIDGKNYRAHRLAWLYIYGEWPTIDIDHVDGDRTNNKIENLRLALRSQNNINSGPPKNNTSGIRGVYWNKKAGKFTASIGVNGKSIYLGLFSSIEEALDARISAEIKYYGEFARVA